MNLPTADGNAQNTLGCVDFSITLNNVSTVLQVLIVPSITHDLILGMDFIQAFNSNLDFRNFTFNSSALTLDSSVAVVRA